MHLGREPYYELIAYVRNEMPPVERAAFEVRMHEDPALKEAVRQHVILIQEIQQVAIRHQVQHMHFQMKRTQRYKRLQQGGITGLGLGLLGLLFYIFWPPPPTDTNSRFIKLDAGTGYFTPEPAIMLFDPAPTHTTRNTFPFDLSSPSTTSPKAVDKKKHSSPNSPNSPLPFSNRTKRHLHRLVKRMKISINTPVLEQRLHIPSLGTYPAPPLSTYIAHVRLRGGTFFMGYNDSLQQMGNVDHMPIHAVTVPPFHMDRYEVTVAAFCQWLNEEEKMNSQEHPYISWDHTQSRILKTAEGYQPAPGYERYPVVGVTWYGAYSYAAYYGKRLPTEAEWEYAARQGWISDAITYRFQKSVTQSLLASTGIYGMQDNVAEWCADWYGEEYYMHSHEDYNPTGPPSGEKRVVRGKRRRLGNTSPYLRDALLPDRGAIDVGFRCVWTPEATQLEL